jgi:hypothetical protein
VKKQAKQHLNEVCTLLIKIDTSLAEIANKSKSYQGQSMSDVASATSNNNNNNNNNDNNQGTIIQNDSSNNSSTTTTPNSRKRKSSSTDENQHVPKKHNHATKKQLEGDKSDKHGNNHNKNNNNNNNISSTNTNYQNHATASSYTTTNSKDSSVISTLVIKKGRPRNTRELEAEKKKLQREYDKLLKAHEKATKAVDEMNGGGSNDVSSTNHTTTTTTTTTTTGNSGGNHKSVDDDLLFLEYQEKHHGKNKNELLRQAISKALFRPLPISTPSPMTTTTMDYDTNDDKNNNNEDDETREFSFPGLSPSCTQDALMVWDFLCTFSRTLSLEPVDLDTFIKALNYKPEVGEEKEKEEKREIMNRTKNNQNDEDYVDEDEGEQEFDDQHNSENDPLIMAAKLSAPIYLSEAHLALIKILLKDTSSDSWWWSILETPKTEAKEIETTGRGEADHITPTMKVDIVALLDYTDEDIDVTRRWLQALEDVREKRTNSGGAIKSAVKSASSITKNPFVKTYLRKSLLHWQSNAAGFTKQSVMWLIGRVREARPDLWGRKIDPQVLSEQKSKIAREAVAAMAELEDAPELESVEDTMQDGESDEEDSDSDDDENNNLDDERNDYTQKKRKDVISLNDEHAVNDEMPASAVPQSPPPTLVDLLLPPSKPLHNSHIVSSFTWPFLAGASICRILHRFKRVRNEVDDSLREFRDLKPLTMKERRLREQNVSLRIFSECVAMIDQNANINDDNMTVQQSAEFLCKGGNYLDLSPMTRLGILRVLIEVAYDTTHVYQCVQDNITSRKNAVTQLEKEERSARKEAKEAASALEQDARQRLVDDATNEFLTKKRRELARANKQTNEFTRDVIDSITIEEIIDMDEDNKAEYEALPSPNQLSKVEVRKMITQMTEERAFNTHALEVLTVEELEAKEGLSLSQDQHEAIELLNEAIEDGTLKALRSAIRAAKNEFLCGEDEHTGGMWTLDSLRDAKLELKDAEKRKRVTEAQKDLVAKRNKCFVRTEELGSDRMHDTFWKLGQDTESRIWLESELSDELVRGSFENASMSTPMLIGACDEEDDFVVCKNDSFRHFSRQEYHSSGVAHSLTRRYYGSLSSSHSLRAILKYLDSRGVREGALKLTLKEIVESSGFSASDTQHDIEIKNDENSGGHDEVMVRQEENDSPLVEAACFPLESYRNKLGRFCGRAVDAPFSSSVAYLSKLVIKREHECYMPLKNRTHENNWGGKSGTRNAWIASMKEYANDIQAIRDGLLTLEDALFEMCGGFHNENIESAHREVGGDGVSDDVSDLKNVGLSGKALLEKRETRFEIELESSVQQINGLWNCRESRLVFREIISCKFICVCVNFNISVFQKSHQKIIIF